MAGEQNTGGTRDALEVLLAALSRLPLPRLTRQQTYGVFLVAVVAALTSQFIAIGRLSETALLLAFLAALVVIAVVGVVVLVYERGRGH